MAVQASDRVLFQQRSLPSGVFTIDEEPAYKDKNGCEARRIARLSAASPGSSPARFAAHYTTQREARQCLLVKSHLSRKIFSYWLAEASEFSIVASAVSSTCVSG